MKYTTLLMSKTIYYTIDGIIKISHTSSPHNYRLLKICNHMYTTKHTTNMGFPQNYGEHKLDAPPVFICRPLGDALKTAHGKPHDINTFGDDASC